MLFVYVLCCCCCCCCCMESNKNTRKTGLFSERKKHKRSYIKSTEGGKLGRIEISIPYSRRIAMDITTYTNDNLEPRVFLTKFSLFLGRKLTWPEGKVKCNPKKRKKVFSLKKKKKLLEVIQPLKGLKTSPNKKGSIYSILTIVFHQQNS